MPEYKKVGYLTSSFKMFHLKDRERHEFSYHYHDFHKILILLRGDVTYCIEGRTYELQPEDIVLVHAGEVHRRSSNPTTLTSVSSSMCPRTFSRHTTTRTTTLACA